jgi:hypothetical protein
MGSFTGGGILDTGETVEHDGAVTTGNIVDRGLQNGGAECEGNCEGIEVRFARFSVSGDDIPANLPMELPRPAMMSEVMDKWMKEHQDLTMNIHSTTFEACIRQAGDLDRSER